MSAEERREESITARGSARTSVARAPREARDSLFGAPLIQGRK